MQHAVHFSSNKQDWRTPKALFAEWHARMRFTIDAAADESNHLLPRWFGPGGTCENMLATSYSDWVGERVWLNPPYGREQPRFIRYATKMALATKCTVVLLVPARTDTKVFHECVWASAAQRPHPWVSELHFLAGRLKFSEAKSPAPFPSMIVVLSGLRPADQERA